MNSKHAKSPCCGAPVRHFGPRRRQCVQCHRTWTVRPRKRGRRSHRTAALVLKRVLVDGFSVGQLHTKRQCVKLPAYRYRFRQALRRYVARSSPQQIARGPLVLLADGLWFEFDGSLGLPHTNNTVESMCRLIREMFRSSRAGSNPDSVLLWATALIRLRPKVTCNGHQINR